MTKLGNTQTRDVFDIDSDSAKTEKTTKTLEIKSSYVSVYWVFFLLFCVSQINYHFVCFLGILLYMFYNSLSCQIKCKPKRQEACVIITSNIFPGARINLNG